MTQAYSEKNSECPHQESNPRPFENEMNIRLSLCIKCQTLVWNLEYFSGNISKKHALTEKRNTWKTIVIFEILNAVMLRKILSFIPSSNLGNISTGTLKSRC